MIEEIGYQPKRKALSVAVGAAVATMFAAPAFAQDEAEDEATELSNIEVTGSRLGRADIEGALPVAVIDRAEIDASGFTSVGELLRNTTFNSFGAFRAQSGSSAQALVTVDLRGLGSERTLVLIDGRRAPKAPFAPSAQDLNSIPMAVVERIEILKDGASAIYGSDAIGGVINIITRKDFEGFNMSLQRQSTAREGGDSVGAQLVGGITGEKGNVIFGASHFSRDIIFARDSLFNSPGASFFSNNYVLADLTNVDDTGYDTVTGNAYYGAVPGGCPIDNPAGYYIAGSTYFDENAPVCGYDFNLLAADEAETSNSGLFARGTYQFSEDWSLTVTGSATRAQSFGRYAPSLAFPPIFVPADNEFNQLGQDFYLYHRFAGLGTRDNDTDANVYDISGIFSGTVGGVDIDVGARYNDYQYYELGQNYVVIPIAESYIEQGLYNYTDPLSNDPAVLNAMKATITRDSHWTTQEFFAEATFDLFSLPGGLAKAAVGAEYRESEYFDKYDPLQEAGVIGGSAGNSAGTDRTVGSAFFETFLPVIENLEVSLSGRFENYNDVGENFAPKLSLRYQPMDDVTLRASVGQGFRAPTLDVISSLPSYSAEPVGNDEATCLTGGSGNYFENGQCYNSAGDPTQQQVNATIVSNPQLEAEKSDQFAVGFAWDVTEQFNFSLDYYNISISDRVNFLSPSEIIDRLGAGDPIPAGLGITRNPNRGNQISEVIAGYANDGTLDTSGLDLEANASFDLGEAGALKSRLTGTYILDYSQDDGRNQVGDPAVPDMRLTLDNTYSWGPIAFALNGNYIASQAETVEDGKQIGSIPDYMTWDVQLNYVLPYDIGGTLSIGAINVFDEEPSAKSAYDGRDYNFYLYDQYGRQPYIKYTQSF